MHIEEEKENHMKKIREKEDITIKEIEEFLKDRKKI